MSFYTYRQNNSGGVLCGDYRYVIIEADSADVANRIAEEHDVYFDGCLTGVDCPCCGDRWDRADEYDAEDKPLVYGQEIDPENPVYADSLYGQEEVLLVFSKNPPKNVVENVDERQIAADLLANHGFQEIADFLRKL